MQSISSLRQGQGELTAKHQELHLRCFFNFTCLSICKGGWWWWRKSFCCIVLQVRWALWDGQCFLNYFNGFCVIHLSQSSNQLSNCTTRNLREKTPSSRLAKTEGLHCPLCRRTMFFMCLSVLYNLLQPHYLIVIEQSFRWGRAQPEGIVKYAKTQFLC